MNKATKGGVFNYNGKDYVIQQQALELAGATGTISVAAGKYGVIVGVLLALNGAGTLTIEEEASTDIVLVGDLGPTGATVGAKHITVPVGSQPICWASAAGADILFKNAAGTCEGVVHYIEVDSLATA